MAEVVRIRRCRGELVQGCDVYIGGAVVRGGWELSVSAWNNPFNTWNSGSQEEACRRYERYLRRDRPDLMARLWELEGKVLGCWCKPESCHGDVLVKLLEEYKGITTPSAIITQRNEDSQPMNIKTLKDSDDYLKSM